MKQLTPKQKIFLIVIENVAIMATFVLKQMIITIFPSYESMKLNGTLLSAGNSSLSGNCTMQDSSNAYVAILIGSKYCVELLMFPVVGLITDRFHPPLILFWGFIVETLACIVYSSTGNFAVTVLARVINGLGHTLVSTAGLTIIYMLYLSDRARSRLITIDSIVLNVSTCVAPYAAGYVYEATIGRGEAVARLSTFMLIGPVFAIGALLTVPFAFEDSPLFSNWFYVVPNEADDNQQSEPLSDLDNKKEDIVESDIKQEQDVKPKVSLLAMLRDKHIMVVINVLILYTMISRCLESTLPIFMIRKFCSDQREQGVVWFFGIMALPGLFFATFLFHLKKSICWILPLLALLISSALCLIMPFTRSWVDVGIILGLLYFLSAVVDVILMPLVPMIIDKKYPNSSYGSASGLTLLAFTISGVLGTFPVGPLVDRFGFLTMCIILALANVILAPFNFCLRSYFI